MALGLNPDLRSKAIHIQNLTLVKILLSAALAVITEVPPGWGGGELIPDRRVKVRQEEEQEETLFQDQAGEVGQVGVKSKSL
jgi:hypothetical protein